MVNDPEEVFDHNSDDEEGNLMNPMGWCKRKGPTILQMNVTLSLLRMKEGDLTDKLDDLSVS